MITAPCSSCSCHCSSSRDRAPVNTSPCCPSKAGSSCRTRLRSLISGCRAPASSSWESPVRTRRRCSSSDWKGLPFHCRAAERSPWRSPQRQRAGARVSRSPRQRSCSSGLCSDGCPARAHSNCRSRNGPRQRHRSGRRCRRRLPESTPLRSPATWNCWGKSRSASARDGNWRSCTCKDSSGRGPQRLFSRKPRRARRSAVARGATSPLKLNCC